MRLKRIIIESGMVHVKWEVSSKEDGYNKHGIDTYDKPKPGFIQAVMDLKDHLIFLWEAESLNKKLIHSSGISIVYKGEHDVMSVKIIGYKTFSNSNGSTPMISPAKEASNPTGKSTATENLLTKDAIDVVKRVIEKAKEFLKGDRIVNVDMFADETPPVKKELDNQDLLKQGDGKKKPAKKAVKKAAKKKALK